MIDRVCYGPLAAAFSDPTTASDTSIAPYADAYFEYDWVRRVSKAVVQGAGCSSCSSGVGTFTMIYDFSISADGYNNWRNKTTTNLPDGGVETTYTNAFGEVMLDSIQDAGGTVTNRAYKASKTTTVNTYAHASDAGQQRAVGVMEKLLSG